MLLTSIVTLTRVFCLSVVCALTCAVLLYVHVCICLPASVYVGAFA